MFIWEVIRFVIVDFFWNIVYFPVWWYTTGTMKIIHLIVEKSRGVAKSLNIKILFQYLFQPMFGQSDIVGRIISFFVRIVDFFVRFILAIIYNILLLLLLVLWLLLPPFILYNIGFHLNIF